MVSERLYNAAKEYLAVIERMERTRNAQILSDLEEERVIRHNRLLRMLKREGIAYRDREDVTRIAIRLLKEQE